MQRTRAFQNGTADEERGALLAVATADSSPSIFSLCRLRTSAVLRPKRFLWGVSILVGIQLLVS